MNDNPRHLMSRYEGDGAIMVCGVHVDFGVPYHERPAWSVFRSRVQCAQCLAWMAEHPLPSDANKERA